MNASSRTLPRTRIHRSVCTFSRATFSLIVSAHEFSLGSCVASVGPQTHTHTLLPLANIYTYIHVHTSASCEPQGPRASQRAGGAAATCAWRSRGGRWNGATYQNDYLSLPFTLIDKSCYVNECSGWGAGAGRVRYVYIYILAGQVKGRERIA